jgi:hypothetical protein
MLKAVENKVQRRITGTNGREATGGCRNLYNEGIFNLTFSTDIRVIKLGTVR